MQEEYRNGVPKYKKLFGIDWGFTAPTALCACLVNEENKVIYIYDEIYKRGLLNKDIYTLLKFKGYDKELIRGDCADPKVMEELRSMGVTRLRASKKGNDSIRAGILKLQAYKIIIHPSCSNAIIEFNNYVWDKDKDGKLLDKPIEDYNHCLTGDTIVNTLDGDIPIKDLVGKSGLVYCFNETTTQPSIGKFRDVRLTGKNIQIYCIELENGKKIKATGGHPVLTQNGWKKVRDLTTTDKIIKIVM